MNYNFKKKSILLCFGIDLTQIQLLVFCKICQKTLPQSRYDVCDEIPRKRKQQCVAILSTQSFLQTLLVNRNQRGIYTSLYKLHFIRHTHLSGVFYQRGRDASCSANKLEVKGTFSFLLKTHQINN